ncbi:MAG: TonB-dependent receptor [Acidobacteria bacterium]|nr:TonB-dependent receptor [Acidobacteriota bacterium]
MATVRYALVTLMCAVLLAVIFPQTVVAQATLSYAQLNGTVLDPSEQIIVGAEIAVRNTGTNRTYNAESNESGSYIVPNLSPGKYEMTVSYPGFSDYISLIDLRVGQTATVNIILNVAGTEEMVTVTEEMPLIEPTRTEISLVIGTEQIESLPVSGRLFTDFALLTPGVASGRTSLGTVVTEFEVTQISFGGQRSFSNIITVDGADFINSISGVQRATPPQESVAEFRVVNNSFGTEYGRAIGGIVNVVTRSGSNDLHGSVYNYLQNSATNARSLLQPEPLPFALRQNQFGGVLSGPIVEDKTFFFLNYEGVRRAETPPLPAHFWSNLETINRAKTFMGIPAEDSSVLKTKDNDYGFARLDHQINDWHHLGIRYNIEDARDLNQLVGSTLDAGGIGAPSAGRNLYVRDQALVTTLDSVLSPTLVNTFLVQYSRRHYNFPGATGEPNIDVGNDLMFGHSFGVNDSMYETRLQFSDDLAWVKGNHAWKFGVDVNHVWDLANFPGFTPARMIFPNLNCVVDFANYVDYLGEAGTNPVPQMPGPECPLPPFFHGLPVMYYGVGLPRENGPEEGQFQNGYVPISPFGPGGEIDHSWPNAYWPGQKDLYDYKLNHGYWGFYVQDRWKATQKLTINYGVRYDFETGLGDHIDMYWGAIQPRGGIAYAPDNKTVIRAGSGLFFDRYNMTFFFVPGNQKTVPGYLEDRFVLPMVHDKAADGGWQVNLVGGPTTADAAKDIILTGQYQPYYASGPCPPACGVGAGGMDRDENKMPFAAQASLQIDRQVTRDLAVSASYLYVSGHRLVRGNDLNMPCPVGTSKPDNPEWAQGWLNPDGTKSPCVGTPDLRYGKPYFLSDQGQPEIPGAGLLDYNDASVRTSYHGMTIQFTGKIGGRFSFNTNYAFSKTMDNGNFTTFINLPQNTFDRKSEYGLSNQDVRHRFVANFTAKTPETANAVLRNWMASSIITMQSARPFTLYVGFDANGDNNPTTDRVGLAGRNTYRGDAHRAWDLRLTRNIQATERLKLDLIFDMFNTLNRPNVDEVSTVYAAPEFVGPVPQHYKDGVSAPNPGFGVPRVMLNPRQMQFAVKLSF